jgi:hypothetical protein
MVLWLIVSPFDDWIRSRTRLGTRLFDSNRICTGAKDPELLSDQGIFPSTFVGNVSPDLLSNVFVMQVNANCTTNYFQLRFDCLLLLLRTPAGCSLESS